MIVIGGVVRQEASLKHSAGFTRRLFMIPVNTIQFVPAQLGMNAGAVGTATWAKGEEGVIG